MLEVVHSECDGTRVEAGFLGLTSG